MPVLTLPRLAVAISLLTTVLAGASAGAAGGQEPRMRFDDRMKVENVCLPVTDPKGAPRLLFGKRYIDGPVEAGTPAIVLVHGIASSTANWDFTPTWSVARALARAGYLVISYDRMGYAKSSYFDVPGGGTTLTTREHRRNLHEIVGDVKTGGYTVTPGEDCSQAGQPSTIRNATVAIIGHSAGGWIVAGYPGQYQDVAAMIQTSIVGSSSRGQEDSPSSEGGGFTPNSQHPDYFDFFQKREECEAFNLFPPGTVRYVADVACQPPFIPSPFGEIAGIGATLAENDANIKRIGRATAVLLASGDHDTTAWPSDAKADFEFYKANCGCDVSQIIIKDTAHLFMAHRSLEATVDYFVSWLRSRGVAPPGKSAAATRPGGRRHARGLTARVTPRRDGRAPFRFRVSGRVQLFTGMAPKDFCRGGRVAVQTKAVRKTVSTRRTRLRSDCTYRITIPLRDRSRLGKSGRLRFTVRFLGNDSLRPAVAKRRSARAGG